MFAHYYAQMPADTGFTYTKYTEDMTKSRIPEATTNHTLIACRNNNVNTSACQIPAISTIA